MSGTPGHFEQRPRTRSKAKLSHSARKPNVGSSEKKEALSTGPTFKRPVEEMVQNFYPRKATEVAEHDMAAISTPAEREHPTLAVSAREYDIESLTNDNDDAPHSLTDEKDVIVPDFTRCLSCSCMKCIGGLLCVQLIFWGFSVYALLRISFSLDTIPQLRVDSSCDGTRCVYYFSA